MENGSSFRTDLRDFDRNLFGRTAVANILVRHFTIGAKFLKRLKFPLAPTDVIEIFVEDNHRPGNNSRAQMLKNRSCRRIEITIHVTQRNGIGMGIQKRRERLIKPPSNQFYVFLNIGERSSLKWPFGTPVNQSSGRPSKESKP